MLLLIIVPASYGTGNNVMVLLLGLQFVSFQLIGERWFRKLVRLGSRIIKPSFGTKQVEAASSGSSELNSSTDDKSMDYLGKTDTLLKVLDVSILTTILMQGIALCVLALVFPESNTWLRVGLGLHGLYCWLTVSASVWQYERCNQAITATNAGLKDVARAGKSKQGINSVQVKFRRHQMILLIAGMPGGLVYVLWGAGIVPINYVLVIVNSAFDALVNSGILLTFVRRGVRRPSRIEQKSKTVTSNNTNQNALIAAAPGNSTLGTAC